MEGDSELQEEGIQKSSYDGRFLRRHELKEMLRGIAFEGRAGIVRANDGKGLTNFPRYLGVRSQRSCDQRREIWIAREEDHSGRLAKRKMIW